MILISGFLFQTKFGRKSILTFPLLFGGIVMLCTMAVPKENTMGTYD